jgi:hypothetical protein
MKENNYVAYNKIKSVIDSCTHFRQGVIVDRMLNNSLHNKLLDEAEWEELGSLLEAKQFSLIQTRKEKV